MSYSSKEIWVPCDSQTITAGGAGVPEDHGAILSNGGDVPRGLLFGVHGRDIAAAGGQLIVSVYTDDTHTSEIYSVTLDFTGGATNASDVMTAPVPMFQTPDFSTEADATSTGANYSITFYVTAIA